MGWSSVACESTNIGSRILRPWMPPESRANQEPDRRGRERIGDDLRSHSGWFQQSEETRPPETEKGSEAIALPHDLMHGTLQRPREHGAGTRRHVGSSQLVEGKFAEPEKAKRLIFYTSEMDVSCGSHMPNSRKSRGVPARNCLHSVGVRELQ